MSRIIFFIVNLITKLHAKFLSLNDIFGLSLTDKQLHFIIIGGNTADLQLYFQTLWITVYKFFLCLYDRYRRLFCDRDRSGLYRYRNDGFL